MALFRPGQMLRRLAAALALAWGGSAARLLLSPSGTDQADCQATACQSLAYAMSKASSGDTIALGPGTYWGPGNRNLDPGSLGLSNLLIQGTQGLTIIDLQSQGRGFRFSTAAGNVVLQGITFTNGSCASLASGDRHGAGVSLESSSATLQDLVFQNMDCSNAALVYGGEYSGAAIFLKDSAALLQRIAVSDCVANHGAGIATWGSDHSRVLDSTFMRNTGTKWGGTMLIEENSSTTFERCNCLNGYSSYGGHIDDGGTSSATFTDCVFDQGIGSYGGGHYAFGNSQLQFINVVFSNSQSQSGGAVYTNGNTRPYFENVTFVNNSANLGGAIRSQYTSATDPVIFKSVRFINNSASSDGGAIMMVNSITMIDTSFVSNSALMGGAAHISSTGQGLPSVFRNVLFDSNTASQSGGVIWTGMNEVNAPVSLTVDNCTFVNNAAMGSSIGMGGGSLCLTGAHSVFVVKSTFRGNTASGIGGAILFSPGAGASIQVNDTVFSGNFASGGGGAIATRNAVIGPTSAAFYRVLVNASSTFGNGGGASFGTSSTSLMDVTFFGNTATEGSGGAIEFTTTVVCGQGSSSRFVNVALMSNFAKVDGGALFFNSLSTSAPLCAVPTLAGSSQEWDPAVNTTWLWTNFPQSVRGNVATTGSLQGTSPVLFAVSCLPQPGVGGSCYGGTLVQGSLGMALPLSVSVQDAFGQLVTDNSLLAQVVVASSSSPLFTLSGITKLHFDAGIATTSAVSMAATGACSSILTAQLLIRFPRSLTALSYVAPAQVNVTLGYNSSTQPLICPGGYTQQSVSNLFVCQACPGGTFAPEGATTCSTCPVGRYSSTAGATTCLDCPPGNGCPQGTSMPAPCDLGSYQPKAMQSQCLPCPQDFYQSQQGQQGCLACPAGTGTLLQGARSILDCVCQAGFFGQVSNASVAECQQCTEGMSCPTGSVTPQQVSGFFVKALASGAYDAVRCRPRQCLEGNPGSCSDGRFGLACGRCMDGYFPAKLGQCQPCTRADVVPIIVACILVICFLMGMLVLARGDMTRQSLTVLTALCTAGQMLVVIQVLAVLSLLQLGWPSAIQDVFSFLNLFRMDFGVLRVQCVTSSDAPMSTYIIELLAFPGVAVLLVICFMGQTWYSKVALDKDRLFNSLGMLFTLCFLPVTDVAISPFQCVKNPNGSSSLQKLPSIICGSPGHVGLVIAGILGTIMYPVFVLCVTAWISLVYPRVIATGGGSRLVRRFQFLFHRFRPECYFYGFAYLVRSTLITCVPLTDDRAAPQIIGFVVVIGAFLCLQCWLQPWRTSLSNFLDAGLSLLLVFFLVASATLNPAPGDFQSIANFVFALMLVVLIAPLVLGLWLAWDFIKERTRGKSYAMFLSHHKLGAGAFARLLKHTVQSVTGARVFLDSDELENLELLMEEVRSRTDNLVLLLSQDTLKRPWCAAEIVMAHKNGVKIVPVQCGSFVMPTEEELELLESAWANAELYQLEVIGITVDDIRKAYRYVASLEHLQMPSSITGRVELAQLHDIMHEICEQCGLKIPSTGPNLVMSYGEASASASTQSAPKATVALLVHGQDLEAVSGASLLQEMIQFQTQDITYICFNEREVRAVKTARHCIVYLSQGCLDSKDFMAMLFAVSSSHPEKIIPVQGDASFRFPSASSIQAELAPAMAQVLSKDLATVQGGYSILINMIALTFTPQMNHGMLKTQVELIGRRLTRSFSPKAERDRSSPSTVGDRTSVHPAGDVSPQGHSGPPETLEPEREQSDAEGSGGNIEESVPVLRVVAMKIDV